MQNESIDTKFQIEKTAITEVLNHAETLIESSRHQEAVRALRKLSSDFHIPTNSEEAWRQDYLLGVAHFWMGEQVAAWEEAERALRIFQKLNGSHSLLDDQGLPSFVLDKLNRLRELEMALLQGLEGPSLNGYPSKGDNLDQKIFEITAALESLKPQADLHHLAGRILMQLGKLNDALDHLGLAATGFKLLKNWKSLAQNLNSIAQLYHIRGELKTSIQILEQAIEYARKGGDTYFEIILRSNIVHCQLQLGIWKPAICSLPQILHATRKANDFPRYGGTLIMWGFASLMRNRLNEAAKAFKEAQKLSEEKTLFGVLKHSYGYMADLHLARGKPDKAEACLKKVVEIARRVTPKGGTVLEAQAAFGELFLARKQYRMALEAFAACQSHLAFLPEKLCEASVLRGMGTCHTNLGQHSLARKEYRKAIEILTACGNDFELSKAIVIAAENRAFTPSEIQPKLVLANDVFRKLEHPLWRKRVQVLQRTYRRRVKIFPLRATCEHTEKELITKALSEANGNITQAAKKLGLLRETLRYKIRRYEIEV